MSERGARLVRAARERAQRANDAFELHGQRPTEFHGTYAVDVAALCDALDEAHERIRELEEQVQTYMEFPYTVPKQR